MQVTFHRPILSLVEKIISLFPTLVMNETHTHNISFDRKCYPLSNGMHAQLANINIDDFIKS